MKELLQVMIEGIVDNKDQVEVSEKLNGNVICLTVKVNKDDMGQIIGKQGKMAKSIRTVIKSVAGKEHKRVNIEFAS